MAVATAQETVTLYYEARNPGRIACTEHKGYSTDFVVPALELYSLGNFDENSQWDDTLTFISTCEDCGKEDSRMAERMKSAPLPLQF